MKEKEVISLLYTIYVAGFEHGVNEKQFPEIQTFEAFNRLIIGESPLLDKCRYDIKEKVELLLKNTNNI
jgi:hypothetical protein